MGRKFLGKTFTLGGQPWYLETGRPGTCDACDRALTPEQSAYRRTFGTFFSKEHHFVHETCMPGYAAEMEPVMAWARQMRGGR